MRTGREVDIEAAYRAVSGHPIGRLVAQVLGMMHGRSVLIAGCGDGRLGGAVVLESGGEQC